MPKADLQNLPEAHPPLNSARMALDAFDEIGGLNMAAQDPAELQQALEKLARAREQVIGSSFELPWIESPFFEAVLAQAALPQHLEIFCRFYQRQGFAKLDYRGTPVLQLCQDIPGQMQPFAHIPKHLTNAWRELEGVKALACSDSLLALLRLLYLRTPIPYQTLNFRYGSEQEIHDDAIFFSSAPAR